VDNRLTLSQGDMKIPALIIVGANFAVKVVWRQDGFPVVNANVSARLFYASVSPGSPPTVSYSGDSGRQYDSLLLIPKADRGIDQYRPI
jgi:hypothetical protein